MFAGLYAKLAASAIVFALVGGMYLYIHNLNSKVTSLNRENATLSQSNDELKGSLAEQAVIQNAIEKVVQAGDIQRAENKRVQQNQLQHIDEGVKQGKDKPVGPILKDFFNEE